MIKKVEELKRLMTMELPTNNEGFENQGKVIGYNEAIEDAVKLLNIEIVSYRRGQLIDFTNALLHNDPKSDNEAWVDNYLKDN